MTFFGENSQKAFNTMKLGSVVIGSFIVISSVSAKDSTLNGSKALSSLRCIPAVPGSKKIGSKMYPKISGTIKAWRLGNFGFDYERYCANGNINPMAIGDAQFHNKQELNERAKLALRKPANQSDGDLTNGGGSKVLASEKGAASHFGSLAVRMRYSPGCEKQFIASSGFGPLGKVVKDALTKSSNIGLLGRDLNFAGACPGYREMGVEQRKNLWVFVMMSMSHFESSCREQVLNTGPNGVAAGLLQLHHDSENLYVKKDPESFCDKGASSDAKKSIRCGLTMIDHQVEKTSDVFDDRSHWQVLRYADRPGTQAYQIRYALSQIPDCKASPVFLEVDLRKPIPAKVDVQFKEAKRSRNQASL